MIRRTLPIIWTAGLVCLAGCASLKTLSRAQDMDYRIRQDRIRHYDSISVAYFLLGHDYYQLAKQLEEGKETARAGEAAQKAEMYLRMHHQLDQAVQEMRLDLEGRKEAKQGKEEGKEGKEETGKFEPSEPPKPRSAPEPRSAPAPRGPAPELGIPAPELRMPAL
jgi:hypothetical protein